MRTVQHSMAAIKSVGAAAMLTLGFSLTGASEARANATADNTAIHSVAWVISPLKANEYEGPHTAGMAVVSDFGGERLLLTACSVIGDRSAVRVAFPRFDDQGNATLEAKSELDRRAAAGIEGKVIWRDVAKDLAIIRPAAVTKGLLGRRLATAAVGQQIHILGSFGEAGGAAWNMKTAFMVGKNRLDFDIMAPIAGLGEPHSIRLPFHEHRPATDRFDAGAPVFNDAGELVGLLADASAASGSIAQMIDLSAIKAVEVDCQLHEVPKLDNWKPLAVPTNHFVIQPPSPRGQLWEVWEAAKDHLIMITFSIIAIGVLLKTARAK